MNTQQRKYVFDRITAILSHKLNALRHKHTICGKNLTPEERSRLIREKKVNIKTTLTQVWPTTAIRDVFDFSEHEWPARVDDAALGPEEAAVRSQATALRDQIMLGDVGEALRLLQEFDA